MAAVVFGILLDYPVTNNSEKHPHGNISLIKTNQMKKLFVLAAMAAGFASCGNNATTTEAEPSKVETEVTTPDPGTGNETTEVTTIYKAADGDITLKEGKLMVYKNGDWIVAEKDITLDDGTVVTVKGDATKDGKTVTIKEGESVSKVGQFFDKTGKAVSNAWDATKEGVKDAGKAVREKAEQAGEAIKEGAKDTKEAIKEGAKKVGDKTKEVIDDLKDKKKN